MAERRMGYWLLKSEPDAFSLDDLYACPKRTDHWDGIRNYQARNYMRDGMRVGDLAFFYHSNCAVPGIVGIVKIVREAYPDYTAFDPVSKYHDPKSDPDAPRWLMVDVRYQRRFKRIVSLAEMKTDPSLAGMPLLAKGSRLSIQPVDQHHWSHILDLETAPRT